MSDQTSPPNRLHRGGSHVIGDRAVVLGAGLSGLLAAAALADYYRTVTVVDRRRLASETDARPGSPARHAYRLRPRGLEALRELLPGALSDSGSTGGAVLDREIGGRVRDLPNVSVLEAHPVLSLVTDAAGGRVTGARVACRAEMSGEAVLEADLVVAATGADGPLDDWLDDLRYYRPSTQRLRVDVGYASRRLRLREDVRVPGRELHVPPTPARPRALTTALDHDGTWLVTVAGYHGHHPPGDADGWQRVVEQLAASSELGAALRTATPRGAVERGEFAASVRRRYDKLRYFPEGLLPAGDAMCSINPVHGQGVALAAVEALTMREVLRHGTGKLGRRYFEATAKPIRAAWRQAVAADLAMPPEVVPGARSLPRRLSNAYRGGFHRNAGDADGRVSDRAVARQTPVVS